MWKNINVNLKALPEQAVMALNYKRKPAQWEPGTVYNTETDFDKAGKPRNQYRVCLDRKSEAGNYLFIYVGDDGIR